ncbi:xanthine dehydrogenase accessory protein XdhC [Acidiphilium sp. PA]|uniref:xanthine dehydrogenase accessory protein XdhC n=1 Tax=Acidiphilium sp. PA TaxID=2871705 RepID=UPI002243CE08|nr:xanthine dehydrogenase accessory protein XdhC [Acidiphilium sp. PA]MCW8308243.1 xanthine dehydrogenase accessory protein XdhC [Acidiphilium sp. PA]
MTPLGVCIEISTVLGSAPREPGARMLVRPGDTEGSIGGGQLEYGAVATARRLLAAWRDDPARATVFAETAALGPQLGQCCGGVVSLRYLPWFAAHLPPEPALFHLQLHGAGHVGRALVAVLAALPCSIDWIDSRAGAMPGDEVGGVARIGRRHVADPACAVACAPAGSLFLVMTHSHALDAAITAAALQRGDAAYVGLIGSATKRARFEHRWRRQGFSDHTIERLTCPIGVAGIAGKQPAVLALGIAAQLLQTCSARSGVRSIAALPADAACGRCGTTAACGARTE